MPQTFQIVISATDKATATVRKVNDAISKITRPFDQAGKSFKSLGRELGFDKISANLSRMGQDARDAARGISSIVAPLAGITSIASIAGVISLADGVGKLSRNITYSAQYIGIGTTQLQEYEAAARLTGIANGTMTESLKSLGDTMEDAVNGRNQQALMLFNRLHVGVKKLRDGTMDATGEFRELAAAIYHLPSAQRQNLAANTLGIGALLPLIRQGPAAFDQLIAKVRQLGIVMSPQQIANANKYAENLAEMDMSVDALKNSIGSALVPALQPLVMQLSAWVSANRELIGQKIADYVRQIGAWIKSVNWAQVGHDIMDVFRAIGKVVNALGGMKGVLIATGVVMSAKFLVPVVSITSSISKLAVFAVSATTGLTGLAAVFGTLATAIAAATGALAGYWIYTHFIAGTKADDAIGEGAARLAAALGIPGAQEALDDMHRKPNAHPAYYHPENTAWFKQRQSQAMSYFMSQGWSRAQAAGIVGNLAQESNLDPNAVNPKSGAMGLAQWLGGRVNSFQQVMHESLKGSSFADQLKFINWELGHTERHAGLTLRKTSAPENATLAFGSLFERFYEGDGSWNRRIGFANDAANAITGPYSQPLAAKQEPQRVHVTVAAETGTKAKVKSSPGVTTETRIAQSAVGASP